MIRTRFAPSPTGFVHIGSLRTALFSYLFARHNKGEHYLRIEDTDQNRFVEGAKENLIEVLSYVGIGFDEGPGIGTGKYGPYVQSERKRLGIYQKYAAQLLAEKKAYYCFCSEERLEQMRKEQTALKKPPMYDRLCRNLKDDEVKTKMDEFKAAGRNPVVRFAIPLEGQTEIEDMIYGKITYDHKVLDDQVILKSDGFPTYHLAVVVDDHLMEITHVIRGEEWIPSTPKHLLIYKALGWQPTQFAHLPLILNPDKSKLSKRQGDVAVEDFLKHGYLKEALINFVAFLGWNPKNDQELFNMKELIEQFDLSKVNKAGAVFDDNKLDWFNSQYIKKLPAAELAEKLKPFWQTAGVDVNKTSSGYLTAVAALEQERLKKLSEIGERTAYFFKMPEYSVSLLPWKKSTVQDAAEKLKELGGFLEGKDEAVLTDANKLQTELETFISEKNYDKGSVLWPLRAALTGMEKSPPPNEVAAVLAKGRGKVEIINRLKVAEEKLAAQA